MLAVAARIPEATTRDQFADRLAHKARIAEEVIRSEIRKAAVAKRTTVPAAAFNGASRAQTGRAGTAGVTVAGSRKGDARGLRIGRC